MTALLAGVAAALVGWTIVAAPVVANESAVAPANLAVTPTAGPGSAPDDALTNAQLLPNGIFAGLSRGPSTGVVNVYLTDTARDYELRVAGGHPLSDFRFVQVLHSYDSLLGLEHDVLQDQSWFESRGLRLTQWGPDVDRNTLRVAVEGLTDHGREEIDDRYGADRVDVVPGTLSRLAILVTPMQNQDALVDAVSNAGAASTNLSRARISTVVMASLRSVLALLHLV